MHVLITGHTGFKGAWLVLLLQELGHKVSGYSNIVEASSLFELACVSSDLQYEVFGDIRDQPKLSRFIAKTKPDVLIHFAAQSLVGESFRNPSETFSVNVQGTLSVLNAASEFDTNLPTVIITTDKVYLDNGRKREYSESDPLQGSEPYGKSKAIADLISQYWMSTGQLKHLAIARAGNVIGGGDTCQERLMPDLISNFIGGTQPRLRMPGAVRPWQHVLDCLNAYLFISADLTSGGKNEIWNIGPEKSSQVSVQEVCAITGALFNVSNEITLATEMIFPETDYLALSSLKLRQRLGWRNKYNLNESISQTVLWHQELNAGRHPREISRNQIKRFLEY
jgi:CDP-glucose 4,6-dehydratase